MDNNSFWINLIAKLKKDQSKQQIKTDVKSLGDIFVKLTGKLDLVKTRKNIKSQLKDLNNNTFTITPTVNNKSVQNATKQAVSNAQKAANSNKVKIDFEVNKQKLINQVKILGRDNSKLFNNSELSAKYNQLLDSAKIAKSSSELKSLRGQLSAFRTELKATNNAGMTWIDKFKSSISSFAQYFSGASFIYAMTNQLKNAWAEAKTLDDRLVDLQKVTDEIADRDALYKYFDRAMSKAQELNVKVDSLLYAITEFKKLGWSLSDAELGGQWATILENVGDVNIDTAIGSIKTAIASFDEIGGYTDAQMDKKIEAYVDLINNMSNKYSIDAEGLSEAIRLSAGTLREAHTSIEKAATIFSTANRYFNDPDYLGNTLKIGSLRMRASSGDSDAISELEEMGEQIDDLAEATSNLRGQLLALTGVDIMVDEHTFKSYYDQLYEISQVIDDLNDTSRANVLETLFGKNRSAAGAAILSGMKESTDAYEEAINSAGSATKEYETWMQSADAATQRFANNLTQMYQSIVNGNTVRDISNLGSIVLEFGNSWGIVEGTIKGVIVLGLGKFITTSTMAIITATKSVEQYGRALQLANNIPDGNLAKRYKSLEGIAQATNLLTDAQKKQVLSNQLLNEQDRISILRMQGMTKELAAQKLAQMGLTQTTNAQTAANMASTVSTFSLKSAMVGLGATIKSVFLSNPVGIAIMAISTAVGFAISATSKYNQKAEESRRKAIELTNAYKEQQSSLEVQTKKYKELKESLDSGNLSTEETRSIKEQLLEIQNSLIDSYGNEASNLDLVNGKYREQLGLLSELSKDKATEYIRKHKDMFDEAMEALEKTRTYNLGTVATWSSLYPKTEEQQNLLDFIESYSDLLELNEETKSSRGASFTSVNLSVKANIEDAENVINEFLDDLDQYSKENNLDIDVLELLDGTSRQLREMWTDELTEYKTLRDEYIKAQITESDTLRPLYQQSISAVEAYNKALSSGDGIEEAKANLDSLQLSVQEATKELEGSQEIFNDIYEGINKNAEAAYNLSQAFEKDDAVKEYAEQLRGLSDVDIKAINFDNDNLEKGEEAFRGLIGALGLTKEQAQTVIDKLVELEYVQGKIVDFGAEDEPLKLFDQLNNSKDSLDKFQSSVKSAYDAYSTLLSGNYSSNELLDSIQAINQAMSDIGSEIQWESMLGGGIGLAQVRETLEREFQKFAESILSDAGINVDSKFGQMLADNIVQAQKASTQLEVLNDQIDSLQSAYSDLTDIVETYNDTGYITFDQLQKLLEMEPQYISCLIDENGQLQLNEQSMIALANKRLDDAAAQAIQQAITELGTLALQDEKVAVEQNAEAFSEAINDLADYNEELANTIAEASVGAAVIRDLNAAIKGAESDGATDDQINTVLTNLETKLQLIKNVRDQANKGLGGLGSVMKSGSSSKKDFEETFDWIETAIDRIERSISNLDLKASSVYRSWSERNANLKSELADVKKEIDIQASGYNRYMQQANSVGLSEEWASKVRNGQIDINSITDKALAERIKEYQDWYRNMPLYLVTGGGILFNC